MVVAANDVRHVHVDVVEDAREVVDRRAVRTHDDEIVELAVLKDDAALHEIVDDGLAVQRHRESDRVVAAGGFIRQRQVRGNVEVAAFAIVDRPAMLALGLLALGVEFFRRAVAWIRFALAQEFQRRLAMPLDSIGLKVCLVGRAFVPFHPEPFQVRELFLERLLRRSLNDRCRRCAE